MSYLTFPATPFALAVAGAETVLIKDACTLAVLLNKFPIVILVVTAVPAVLLTIGKRSPATAVVTAVSSDIFFALSTI